MTFGTNTGDGTGALSVYAGNWPSIGDIPGQAASPGVGQQGIGPWRRDTTDAMLRAKQSLWDSFMENWLPFSTWITSRFIAPRASTQPWQSPFDLDSSERITRFGAMPSADRPFPYPYEIGAVSNLMPMLDQYSLDWAWGKTPSGPGVLTPISVPYQASYPNLRKQTG